VTLEALQPIMDTRHIEKVLEEIRNVLRLAREEAVIRGRKDRMLAVVRTIATAAAAITVIVRVT
jgi:Tfp pilus assembly protein FimT